MIRWSWIPILTQELLISIEEPLFNWNSVPGEGSEKLIGTLRDKFKIDLGKNVKISKSGDDRAIFISNDENVEIIKEENKRKVVLKIGDRSHYLRLEKEGSKLNVYPKDVSYNTFTFRDATGDNIKRLLHIADWGEKMEGVFQKEMIISDRLLHLKHLVKLSNIHKDEDILKLNLEIWPFPFLQKLFFPREKQPLIKGQSEIHANGLVKLKIDQYPTYEKYEHPEEQMHKVIRDVFHKHVHHSSDMLLPPVDAQDKKAALEKIILSYLEKFIIYKRVWSHARPKDALNDVMRAQGEIEYARSYLAIHDSELQSDFFKGVGDSFKRFMNTFKILEARSRDVIRLAVNYMMFCLTTYVLLVTIILLDLPSWTQEDLVQVGIFTPNLAYLMYGFIFVIGAYFIYEAASRWLYPRSSL
ncbi:MAG: hypothetical protein KAT65_07790 [Methanophagales archaeon]|nr:hypothetical protein [Methanophagales archaeon]